MANGSRQEWRRAALHALPIAVFVLGLYGYWFGIADRYADPEKVAFSLFRFAYRVGVSHLPDGVSALQYTRNQLDRLEIGADLMQFSNGTRQPKLPRSRRAQGSPEGASSPIAT